MWPFSSIKKVVTSSDESADEDYILCATANIVQTRLHGEEKVLKRGTKHFRGGAKVYVVNAYAGMCEDLIVIGHHRKSGRYITIAIRAKHLENFRITKVFSPKVLYSIRKHYDKAGSGLYSKNDPEYFCKVGAQWSETERENKRQQTNL